MEENKVYDLGEDYRDLKIELRRALARKPTEEERKAYIEMLVNQWWGK